MMKPNVYAAELLDRITDQRLLVQIARQCETDSFRRRVAERIESAEVLEELAQSDANWEVRAIAYRRLGNDSEADTLVAQHAYSEYERCKAIASGNVGRDVLLRICLNDPGADARKTAFLRLADKEDITYVAVHSTYQDAREWALEKMPDDQQILLKAVKKYHSDAAFARLNPTGLFQIFLSGSEREADLAGTRLIRLSEEGRSDWIASVNEASLQALVRACFEKHSTIAGALLKLIYQNGRFAEQIGRLRGRMILPKRHSDAHHEYYDLGDHVDMGHTDAIEQPMLFQPD
ncbi:MAG: hypothetical protein GX417_06895 [Clostridiales bacterium]|nr:hypothetical protein [Clostridiales bacterium]